MEFIGSSYTHPDNSLERITIMDLVSFIFIFLLLLLACLFL